jgi:sulfonate transport system permease protein
MTDLSERNVVDPLLRPLLQLPRLSPRTRRQLAPVVSPLLILVVWTILSESNLFAREILVPPSEVWATLVQLLQDGELQEHLQNSLLRLFSGYALGAVIGLALGVAMGLSRSVESYLSPLFQLIRQVPTIALIPAFILVFGIGETVKIVLVAKATSLPVALAAFEGVRDIQRSYFDVAAVYRARRLQLLRYVVLPATVPPILTGMRIALGRSWMVLIGAELLVSDSGMGQLMEWGRQMFRIDIVLVGVVLTGVIGFVFDKGFRLLERRLVHWKPQVEA